MLFLDLYEFENCVLHNSKKKKHIYYSLDIFKIIYKVKSDDIYISI